MKNHRYKNNNPKRDEIRRLVAIGKTSREIHLETGYTMSTIRYYREPSKHDNHRQISSRISMHRRRIKRKAVDYSGGKCIRCSYNRHENSLAFHHLDPSTKESGIASGCTHGWDRTKIEVDKTILVCHNCHAEYHAGLWEPDQQMIHQQMVARINYIDKPLFDYGRGVRIVDKTII